MLCLDNLNNIIKLLSRKELYYLSVTSKFYHQLVNFKQVILDTIKRRLKLVFGDYYDELMVLINDNLAFISGSFIIQCILDDYYNSDVDFYCTSIDNEAFVRPKSYLTNLVENQFNDLECYFYLTMRCSGCMYNHTYYINQRNNTNGNITNVRDYNYKQLTSDYHQHI